MGFLDWLTRRAAQTGAPGETARVVGQQYLALKQQNPQATDAEIFRTIAGARHAAQPYTSGQLTRLEYAVDARSVGEFVVKLVLVESNVTARELQGGPLQSIVGTVNGELRKLGLD